jgi:UDP-N-acetylglucosamine 3-dehydrogenase
MEKMVKIGIIGAGIWGSNHAKALRSLGALCCIYDSDIVRAKNIAQTHGITVMQQLDEMLESDADGIILATPASTHAQIILNILKTGKGLLVEKPMVVDMNQALAVKSQMKADSKLVIGYTERFNPAVISLINCLEDKDKLSLTLFRVGNRPERIKDVGVVLDTMIHDINIVNHLLGPTRVSSAWSVKDVDKREIFVTATVESRTGTAHLVASWISNERLRMGIGVSHGTVVSSNFITQESKCLTGGKELITKGNGVDLLKAEDEAFIRYLRGEEKFPGQVDDAIADLDLALRILNKIEEQTL